MSSGIGISFLASVMLVGIGLGPQKSSCQQPITVKVISRKNPPYAKYNSSEYLKIFSGSQFPVPDYLSMTAGLFNTMCGVKLVSAADIDKTTMSTFKQDPASVINETTTFWEDGVKVYLVLPDDPPASPYVPPDNTSFLQNLKFAEIPGIVVIRRARQVRVWNKIYIALNNSAGLLLISLLIVFFFGVLMWLIERWDTDPLFDSTFHRGAIIDGFWWGCVTLTTVGYGDIAPKRLIGRAVGIVYMVFCLVILSSITSNFTNSFADGTVSLSEKNISVVNGSVVEQMARLYIGSKLIPSEREEAIQAQIHSKPTVEDVMDEVAYHSDGNIVGLLDMNEASEYANKMDELELVATEFKAGVLPIFAYMYAPVVQSTDEFRRLLELATCFSENVVPYQASAMSANVVPIDITTESTVALKDVFNITEESGYLGSILLIMFFVVIMCGVMWDMYIWYKQRKNNTLDINADGSRQAKNLTSFQTSLDEKLARLRKELVEEFSQQQGSCSIMNNSNCLKNAFPISAGGTAFPASAGPMGMGNNSGLDHSTSHQESQPL